MNIAELTGSIGVAVMLFKTDLERAIDDMQEALEGVSTRLQKLQSGDLRKRLSLADYLDEVNRLSDEFSKLLEIAERRSAAFPAFKAWATNTPCFPRPPGPFLNIGEPIWPTQAPTIDPTAAASDAILRHRHDANPKGENL